MKFKGKEKTKPSILSSIRYFIRVLTNTGDRTVRSSDIRVGDILKLHKDQRVPIDGVLLHTADILGTVFVRTDQLDGETDWKVRESVRFTQRLIDDSFKNIFATTWNVMVEAPSDLIYDFSGNFYSDNGSYEPLRLNQAIWANMRIATGEVYVLTVYTGKETRMALNSKKPIDKFGKTDIEINSIFKTIFVIFVFVTLFLFFISGEMSTKGWFIYIVRTFAILSTLLPFMLKLNVDLAKLFYAHEINNDPHIEGTIVRNRQIPEELGRIEYLLSDKTGTLTRNEMIFKHLRTLGGNFSQDNFEILKQRLQLSSNAYENNFNDNHEHLLSDERFSKQKGHLNIRESVINDYIVKDTIISLILCNNVSPTFNNGERMLQASSPDEVSLVNFAEELGYFMESRRTNSIKIRNPDGRESSYEILENFAFSSERKRMGILLRNHETRKLIFYLKGADAVFENLISAGEWVFVKEQAENLSIEGLRTLVLTQKLITENEYKIWKDSMNRASQNLKNRVEAERKCIEELEKGMKLLGVTGVEDLLQEDIKSVILNIRDAGIKVWMLTGDKLETAKSIAISTGFKTGPQKFYEVNSLTASKISMELSHFDPYSSVLLISGQTLDIILQSPSLKENFLHQALKATSVVLCRCAPKQKAEVALILKEELKKVVCGIGDGGNDVGMIQCASIGIGIEGKEGLQASLASDFSVKKFKNILKLFLWHGRLSYLRSTTLANLVIHRGFILTTIQYLFMISFNFVSINIYNGYLNMFYGTLFTNIVVFSMIFDVDIPIHQAFNYPSLYKLLQEGGELSIKMLCIWMWKAIFQGAVIILLSLKFFENNYLEIITITFTALVLVEYLTIVTIVRTWHSMMVIGIFASFTIYIVCLIFLKDIFLLSTLELEDYLKIVFLVMCGWLPLHFVHLIQRICFPSQIDKIIREAKTQEKRKKYNLSLRSTQFNL
jgi:phospholipid-translocating ATPase